MMGLTLFCLLWWLEYALALVRLPLHNNIINLLPAKIRQSSSSRSPIRANCYDRPTNADILVKGVSFYLPPKYLTEAIEFFDRQPITAAQLALAAGVHESQAYRDLLTFAHVTRASMRVNDKGVIEFVIPSLYKSVILQRSVLARFSLVWAKLCGPIMFGCRVLFGVSFVVVLAVLSSLIHSLSTSDDGDTDENSSRRSRVRHRNIRFNPFNHFSIYNVNFARDSREEAKRLKFPFLSSVFSYVFGDDSPSSDSDFQEVLYKQAATTIWKKGGVVLAEELVPFLLDPPPVDSAVMENSDCTTYGLFGHIGESCILPIVCLLNGDPLVTENGYILYHFQGISQFKSARDKDLVQRDKLFQQYDTFSKSSAEILAVVGTLGVIALMGTAYITVLTAKIKKPINATLMSALWFYTLTFNILPATRAVLLLFRNSKIKQRNERRQQWLNILRPDKISSSLKSKQVDREKWRQAYRKEVSL